jgi:hypothetical protein
MIMEKQVECRLAGETEVLGQNLPQRHLCPSENLTWPDPGLIPGRRGGKPAIIIIIIWFCEVIGTAATPGLSRWLTAWAMARPGRILLETFVRMVTI